MHYDNVIIILCLIESAAYLRHNTLKRMRTNKAESTLLELVSHEMQCLYTSSHIGTDRNNTTSIYIYIYIYIYVT